MVNTQKQLEEAYLKNVYQKLIDKKNELRESMDTAKIEGNQSLKEMAGELRLNFDSYLDNLDTFSMIEMKNREIDQMNIKQKNAENQLAKIERLLKSPYFGKVVVDFLDNEPKESFYIGTANFTDDADENLVYDWRSPIAELFYNNMIGPSSYTVRQNKIDTVIKERRQFLLERDRLVKFFDTSVAIQDNVLLEVLGQDETNEMKAITATIQSEQNTIIRDVKSQNILVNGVAGSGKTSAIMQRIAYLLYLYRDTMTSDDLLILSPNHRFIDYISNVLPSLGERNPLNLTIIQLVSQLSAEEIEGEEAYFKRITGENVSEQTERLRSKKFIDNLKQSDPLFLDHPNFIRGLTKNGKTVLSKKTIEKIYEKVPAHPKLIDRLQATKKALMSEWKNHLLKQAKSPAVQNQVLSLTEDRQLELFGKLISDDSEQSIVAYARKLLQKKYRKITRQIEEMAWVDEHQLFERIYEKRYGSAYAWQPTRTVDEAVIEFSSIVGIIKRTQSAVFGGLYAYSGANTMYRKEALIDVGGFRQDRATEDISIVWDHQLNDWLSVFAPEIIFFMEVPVTLKMLYRQRKRWAKGGTEVWLTNFKKVMLHPFKHIGRTIIFIDQTLSIVWSIFFCISVVLFAGLIGHYVYQGNYEQIYITFTFSFVFICFEMVAGFFQLLASLIVDDRRRKLKYLLFAPLYMLLFWIVNAITIVTTFIPAVKTILGYGSGTWKSPERTKK